MTVDAALTSFLDWLAAERRASPATITAYRHDIATFLGFLTRHLGAAPDRAALGALTAADFRAWLAERAAEGVTNATRARGLAALRSLLTTRLFVRARILGAIMRVAYL
ncbi:MAG: site-specific integrase, partial [Elioraea tepidiphila]